MQLPGHVGAALTAYSPVGLATASLGHPELALAGGVVTVGLSPLPDCDLYVPGVVHRGYAHTVWFAIAVGISCGVAGALAGGAPGGFSAIEVGVFWFVVGTTAVLSHVAVDGLTPMGVTPFAPVWRGRFSLCVTRSASPVANRRFLLLGVGSTTVAVVLGGGGFPLGW